MALADILLHKGDVTVEIVQTEAGATEVNAGEPVKLKSAGSPYGIPLADNEPAIGTTTQVKGVAATASTHTATADGVVAVYVPDGEAIWVANATTPANIAATIVEDRVLLDLVGGIYTVDENAGDGATNGIQITGVDTGTSKVYFKIRPAALEGPTA